MQEEKTEGIVLRCLDYRDNQRIITLFTPLGLISLIVKGISKRRSELLSLSSMLCEGEFLFKRGRSDLLFFLDGSILDMHLLLRERLSSLQTAGRLGQAILISQLSEAHSSDLYQLFRCYMRAIPSFEDPTCLLASFQLKLLVYEGLLRLSSSCNRCREKKAHILSKGESLCGDHPFEESVHFSHEEWSCLEQLQMAKHFSMLRSLSLPEHLSEKIDHCFNLNFIQETYARGGTRTPTSCPTTTSK